MFRRVLVCSAVAAAMLTLSPAPSSGASKEILELQRDVATLQDMVKAMQRSQDERFAALQVLVQQSLNAANDASKSAAVIQSGFQQNMRELETKVVTPVVGLGARMDQVSTDLRTVSQAVSDLTGLISKLQSQLTDLNNSVKVIQQPPAATSAAAAQMVLVFSSLSANPCAPASMASRISKRCGRAELRQRVNNNLRTPVPTSSKQTASGTG